MTTAAESILDGLNPAQREAVETIEGPLLIAAGPGSGKTRVITHRIAYLVRVCGVTPYRILAVTFTNKAAREMKERLERLVGARAEQLTVGTFHAFCASVLRRDGKHVGVESNFTIYDDEDQINLVKQALEAVDLDPKRFHPRAVLSSISRSKSQMVDSHALEQNQLGYFEAQAAKVYRQYDEILSRNNAVDFDDLLMKTVVLFRDHPDVLKKYQRRYQHVLIDEFQDTNIAQYSLARLLSQESRNICVVGDADQSIYSWRHADIRNILSFQNDYPEARTVNLDENYRSTGAILEAASNLISANKMRLAKDLRTSKGTGALLVTHEVYDQEEEAQFALQEIDRLSKHEGYSYGDCAVMYRVNSQSRALEEACARYGMKYRLVGGVRFYQRREVKDVMAYLRLLANPEDDVSLSRIINTPTRGIGQRTVQELTRMARSREISLMEALRTVASGSGSSDDGVIPPSLRSSRAARPLADFLKLMDGLAEESRKVDVVELVDSVVERTGYKRHLEEKTEDSEERLENIRELRHTAQEFRAMDPPDGLISMLERLALVANVDDYVEASESLTLITLHQAKGLEFPVVFILGMEEGVLPHFRSMDSEAEIEEERRLCYVGMTRSKERLYLLRAFRRNLMGMGGFSTTLPSRFLEEIPRHLTGPPATAPRKVRTALARDVWEPAPAPAQPQTLFKSGDKVRHPTFGEGMVVSCVPSGSDFEVTVAFTEGAGVKRLLLSFAHLEHA